jgi:hypothetical protein
VRAATINIAARHAGFVVGLALIAPVLSTSLNTGAREAAKATTQEVLQAPISLRSKVTLALDLRDLVVDAPRGKVPDVTAPFDAQGASQSAGMHATREGVLSAIRDTLTRGFRGSFLIAALLGALAAVAAACLPGVRPVTRSIDALSVAVAIMVLVLVLVAAEFRAGARHYGVRNYVDPCHAPADPFPEGHGVDGTLQRISLSALDGAACKLGTSREELLLSLEPASGFGDKVKWTRPTLEAAVRAGLLRAIDDADHRNTLPAFAAAGLRLVAKHAPIDWVLGRIHIPFLEG